mgnify:CR=1 FL=1
MVRTCARRGAQVLTFCFRPGGGGSTAAPGRAGYCFSGCFSPCAFFGSRPFTGSGAFFGGTAGT